MIKVLFIHSVDPLSELESRCPPLWPGLLAAAADRRVGEGRIEHKYLMRDLEIELDEFQPDIVGIGSVTQNFPYAMEHARICKERYLPVLIGGSHISTLPHKLPDVMDIGCVGESEETYADLMALYLDTGAFPKEDLENIPGLVFSKNGELIQTPFRPLAENLDDLAHPKRSIYGKQPSPYLMTSRGCPYTCTFCAPTRYWKKTRFASPEYVMEEIDEVVAGGARHISFYDELFVAHKKRVRKIAELIIERGYHKIVRFHCNVRANLITAEMAQILRSFNVRSVAFGLESGNDRVLQYLKGESVTVEDNELAVNYMKDVGIDVTAFFIIGSPDETREEIMDTYNFIKNSRIDFFEVNVLLPYPGTPVWDWCMEKGLVSEEMDWHRLNMNFECSTNGALILSQTLTVEEIRKLYNKFRRLRWYRIITHLPRSNRLGEVPRMAVGIAREMIVRFWRKAAFGT